MTLKKFICTYINKKVDYKDDTFKGDNSFQYVDLYRQYCKEAKTEYEKVKDVIQHPNLYKSIKRSTIKAANSYISSKTDKIVDYTNIIRNYGVAIED